MASSADLPSSSSSFSASSSSSWFDPLAQPFRPRHGDNYEEDDDDRVPASLFWALHLSLSARLLEASRVERETLQRELAQEVRRRKEAQREAEGLRSEAEAYALEAEAARREAWSEGERCEAAMAEAEASREAMERERAQRFAAEAKALKERQGRERAERKLLAMAEEASRLRQQAAASAEKEALLEEEEMKKKKKTMKMKEEEEEEEMKKKKMKMKEEEEEEEEMKKKMMMKDDKDEDEDEDEELGLGFDGQWRAGKDLFLEYSPIAIAMATEASNGADAVAVEVDQWGSLCRGELHCIPVAIRSLALPTSAASRAEFKREVGKLSRIHHPRIVTLLGACPLNACIVYEYMPNGTVEQQLRQQDNRGGGGAPPALSCNVRFRICCDIATALLFLHTLPQPVSHGSLSLDSVFLDNSLTAKLGNVGISRLIVIDAEGAQASTDLHGDVRALGMAMLRLLTGLPANQATNAVAEALDNDQLNNVLDPSAGDWPFLEAMELACLCLQAVEDSSIVSLEELVMTLEKIRASADCSSSSTGPSQSSPQSAIANHFLCPISQEVMEDPCIAADGFTYEHEFINAWLQNHDNSPMTNLRLPNKALIPNLSLKSAINEWRSQQL